MRPRRSAAGRQRAVTRIPLDMASGEPASTTWSMAVVAPSSRTSAQAKGRSRGWSFLGSAAHDHVVTTPDWPTSTRSPTSALVTGSYSVGGTMTVGAPSGVVRLGAQDAPVAQPREEGADDGADRAHVGVLEDVRRPQDFAVGHHHPPLGWRTTAQTRTHCSSLPARGPAALVSVSPTGGGVERWRQPHMSDPGVVSSSPDSSQVLRPDRTMGHPP